MNLREIDEATVRRVLPMTTAINLLEQAFRDWHDGHAQNQSRRRMLMPSGAMLHTLGGATDRYFGAKIYSTHPRHGAWFHFLLYDVPTGQPLALMEANWLGQIRTGAASGLATSRLARRDAATVAILGSGFQARAQVDAIRAVRKIERVIVHSRNPEKAAAFAAEKHAEVAMSAADAVREADIVCTATGAKDPLFEASDIRPGTHINAIGSNQATRRELPAAILRRASYIAVDSVEQAKHEAGDLLLGLEDEEWDRVDELRNGRTRMDPDEITIFKSIGLGLEDVAVAAWVYENT